MAQQVSWKNVKDIVDQYAPAQSNTGCSSNIWFGKTQDDVDFVIKQQLLNRKDVLDTWKTVQIYAHRSSDLPERTAAVLKRFCDVVTSQSREQGLGLGGDGVMSPKYERLLEKLTKHSFMDEVNATRSAARCGVTPPLLGSHIEPFSSESRFAWGYTWQVKITTTFNASNYSQIAKHYLKIGAENILRSFRCMVDNGITHNDLNRGNIGVMTTEDGKETLQIMDWAGSLVDTKQLQEDLGIRNNNNVLISTTMHRNMYLLIKNFLYFINYHTIRSSYPSMYGVVQQGVDCYTVHMDIVNKLKVEQEAHYSMFVQNMQWYSGVSNIVYYTFFKEGSYLLGQ